MLNLLLSFVEGDVNNGLEEFGGQYDVVHCRSVRGHVRGPLVDIAGV